MKIRFRGSFICSKPRKRTHPSDVQFLYILKRLLARVNIITHRRCCECWHSIDRYCRHFNIFTMNPQRSKPVTPNVNLFFFFPSRRFRYRDFISIVGAPIGYTNVLSILSVFFWQQFHNVITYKLERKKNTFCHS